MWGAQRGEKAIGTATTGILTFHLHLMQYYNLIHLGFNCFRAIIENAMANSRLLSKPLEATGWYACVSDMHRPEGQFNLDPASEGWHKEGETSADYNPGLPVVAFRLSDAFRKDYPHIKQEAVNTMLRVKQYIIPSMTLALTGGETSC